MLVVVATLAGACGSSGDRGGEPRPEPRVQLDWTGCGRLECAMVPVPIDHADPSGPTIEIGISRHTASGARVGVLVVNPGGPGASGLGLPAAIADAHPALGAAFDIIGFDPRGVGASAELRCDDGLDTYYRLDNDPDDQAERDALIEAAAAASRACGAADAALLANIGTSAVVDDVEAIRRALGEEQISYLGLSYGSVIGLVYATRYGPAVRAMVVDGVTDPADSLSEWLISQAGAADVALGRVLDGCDGCDGSALLDEALTRAEDGLPAGDSAAGPSDVARAAILETYGSPGASVPTWLTEAAAGDGTGALARSNNYLALAGFDTYTAVKCLDTRRPADVEAYFAFVEDARAVAPVLGVPIAMELLPCASWPVPSEPLEPIDDADAPGILVLGNTGDAATPYADAVEVVDRLSGAVLVTFDGSGHLSLGRGSDCVDDVVAAHLVDLQTPEPGLRCD